MWDKVVEVVGPQFPVAVLFAAWAMTTFVYYRRLHDGYARMLKEQFAQHTREVVDARKEVEAELRRQIASLKRDRAGLRKELRRRRGEDKS